MEVSVIVCSEVLVFDSLVAFFCHLSSRTFCSSRIDGVSIEVMLIIFNSVRC